MTPTPVKIDRPTFREVMRHEVDLAVALIWLAIGLIVSSFWGGVGLMVWRLLL